MAVEIERKFLVVGDEYRRMAYSSDRIVQGYICRADGNSVRVRIRDGRGYLTIKGPSLDGGLSRYEWEREISLAEAEDMLLLCRDAKIDKRRYLVKCGSHTYEVDEFYGDNEGLTVAEVELQSEEEAFVKPAWLGEEVTGDVKYYNSMLMKNPYKNWK